MDRGVGERLIRQVVASTVGACEACAQPFDELSASVVGHQDDLWFLSLVCGCCQRRILVAALVQQGATVAVGDSPAPGRSRRVDAEDVLAVRQFLDKFDGDFQTLFGRVAGAEQGVVMRTILYTGKGGVGKTSTAAATALRCAKLGYRTIVLSTDLAHSLADSFDRQLAAEPVQVVENLWAQEVDVYHEIHRHWGAIQDYISTLFAWRGLDEAIAEEMTVPPGMEELSSLLLISRYAREGNYDVCIVDTAPTGETLRLLSFPEVARWWVRNIMPLSRKVSQVLSPVARRLTDMPIPSGDVFDSVQSFLERLDAMHHLLSDPKLSTVRLVVNPEKMVIKEAQRTFTYLNLYGYSVDAIVCNRIIPDDVDNAYFGNWKEIQRRYFELIQESFEPLPIFRTPLFDEEMVGERMLGKLADAAYGDVDPTQVFYEGRAQIVTKEGDGYVLTLALPLAAKPDVEMMRAGEELIVKVGSQRRNVVLPRALAGLEVRDAKFDSGQLRVRFA